MRQDSRHLYFSILNNEQSMYKMRESFAVLLQNDPYFMPARLEMLWFMREHEDSLLFNFMIEETFQIIRKLSASRLLQKEVSERWSSIEKEALEQVMELMFHSNLSLLQKTLLTKMRFALRTLIVPKTSVSATDGHFLKLLKTVDPEPLQQEIGTISTAWWAIDTCRHEEITHHRQTRLVSLRERTNHKREYIPIEGVHESKPTRAVELFPKTHEVVLDFATEHDLALGRVAIVRMSPRAQAYRHYDAEPWYKIRNRYHLVVQAGATNILSVGNETVNARPGEIWFFANKVMHRAHNRSNIPRIHVIFDGYPLDRKGDAFPT